MVEFAVVAPILMVSVFMLVDFARLLYTFSAISSAAREGARVLSVASTATTDCPAFQRMESMAQGFRLVPDPNSKLGDAAVSTGGASGPSSSSGVTNGQAYAYVYPAEASGPAPLDQSPGCTNTNGTTPTRRDAQTCGSTTCSQVEVFIQYKFQPLTPIVSSLFPNIVIATSSTTHLEY